MSKHNGKTQKKENRISIPCRYTIGNIDCPDNYKKIFEEGKNTGIDVTHVRHYFNPNKKEQIEMYLKLPYKYNGKNTYGYVVINCDEKSKLHNEIREYNTCEIWTGEPGEYGATTLDEDKIYSELYTENEDGTKEKVDGRFLYDEIGIYASAASNYPHIFTYDEYIQIKTQHNKKLGLNNPTEEDYYQYINKCIDMMSDTIFIGKTKTKIDAELLKMDTPSSKHFLQSMREIPDINNENQNDDNQSSL